MAQTHFQCTHATTSRFRCRHSRVIMMSLSLFVMCVSINVVISEKSKLLTESRFATMRARDNKMNELKREVTAKLSGVASDPKYRDLVRFLIAQGLMTMLEHEVSLQCRQQDLAIVQSELPKALQMFQDQMKGATGISPTCNVTIDLDNFLPPGPKDGQQGASWYEAQISHAGDATSSSSSRCRCASRHGCTCASICNPPYCALRWDDTSSIWTCTRLDWTAMLVARQATLRRWLRTCTVHADFSSFFFFFVCLLL